MHPNLLKYLSIVIVGLTFSCSPDIKNSVPIFSDLDPDASIRYAKRFSISSRKNITVIYLFGNKSNFDTTAIYAIYNDSLKHEEVSDKITVINRPCEKIAALSSIYSTMFVELGLIDKLVAIDNVDYVNNEEIILRCNDQKIKELSKGPEIDLEKTIHLNPDVLFIFGMGDPSKDVSLKLLQTKIPVALSLDHLEETPLARAEWIKFFAAFVNKKDMADSIFSVVEKNYLFLKELAIRTPSKPTVFNDIKYSEVWYAPGGKSYMAKLLNDAGADYLWKTDQHIGSIPLSFEQVFAKAKTADFWINPSTIRSKKELESFDSRYHEFAAFKNNKIYNNTKVVNQKGYSSYWETGMVYPNKILSDLILIFHPELKEKINTDFHYYQKLN